MGWVRGLASANGWIVFGLTRLISPKSRKTSRPSSASIRLPSWGSACTMPVTTRDDVTASTAMYVIRKPSAVSRCSRWRPYT